MLRVGRECYSRHSRTHPPHKFYGSRPRCSAMPSSQLEHCRQKSVECEEEVKRATSQSLAATWLQLARQWREMADRIDEDR